MTPAANAEPKRFALGASPDCRRVTVDGVSIAYDDRGDGFPIVGLHAITHGSRDFEHVADRLASRWRLITPDWPGQGRSGVDTHPARLARYTDLLAGFMDALNIDRAVLIGNSIGGSAAMAYAAQFPSRVAALVLADPGGLVPMNELWTQVLRHDGGVGTRRPARCVLLQAGLLDAVSAVSENARRTRAAGSDCRCGRRMRRNLGAGVAGLSYAASRSDRRRCSNRMPGSVHLGLARFGRLVRAQQGGDRPLSKSFGSAFRRRPLPVPRRAGKVSRCGRAVSRNSDCHK